MATGQPKPTLAVKGVYIPLVNSQNDVVAPVRPSSRSTSSHRPHAESLLDWISHFHSTKPNKE